jgi:hypothetical protein
MSDALSPDVKDETQIAFSRQIHPTVHGRMATVILYFDVDGAFLGTGTVSDVFQTERNSPARWKASDIWPATPAGYSYDQDGAPLTLCAQKD